MPYSKEHKEKSREKILDSAYRLFTSQGFDAVSIDQIMTASKLTRGTFYTHFKSKSDLYQQALTHGTAKIKIANLLPKPLNEQVWIKQLLENYLSLEHVEGKGSSCPLAFLVTDVAIRDSSARNAYTRAYNSLNKLILKVARSYTNCSEELVLSVTAMIIGAVAIARTMDDPTIVENLLESCKKEAELKLGTAT